MTRPSKRELEREVAELRESGDGESDGFHHFLITPDGECPEQSGFYEFDPEIECYVNENGHMISADAAPDSEFDYTIEFVDEAGAVETRPTGEAAIREALSGIPDEEADR